MLPLSSLNVRPPYSHSSTERVSTRSRGSRSSDRGNVSILCCFLLLLTTTWISLKGLEKLEPARKLAVASDPEQTTEALYLPSTAAAEISSLGYRNMLSHILWFNTINYFGKHYRREKNYRWFSHMCDLVTRLNPRLDYVYPFCSTLLSWEGDQPEESIKILNRAIQTFPLDWNFLYLRGFTKIFFLNDQAGGDADFIAAASLPDAHPIVKSLAARSLVSREGPDSAIQFLSNSLRLTKDPSARSALESRLKDAIFAKELSSLQQASRKYQETEGRHPSSLEELVDTGLVSDTITRRHFADPLGGKYTLDPVTGTISSSSGTPTFSPTWNTKEERDKRIAKARAEGLWPPQANTPETDTSKIGETH